jgi:hypothetical protein
MYSEKVSLFMVGMMRVVRLSPLPSAQEAGSFLPYAYRAGKNRKSNGLFGRFSRNDHQKVSRYFVRGGSLREPLFPITRPGRDAQKRCDPDLLGPLPEHLHPPQGDPPG